MNRRGFLGARIATLAAPAIIRTPGLLMAVRSVPSEFRWDWHDESQGIPTLGSVGGVGGSITRRAVIPSYLVRAYQAHPLMRAMLLSASPEQQKIAVFESFEW